MLVAEIHGHRVPEAINSEDYLTSAVFGHLRYLSPTIFWNELFKRARGMPGAPSHTLRDYLQLHGIDLNKYQALDVRFWSTHPLYGCPDLILVLSGTGCQPFVLVIEAKLWSNKSGTGDFDQIARYLRLLDDPAPVVPRLPEAFSSALVYLTEHDSLPELEDSVQSFGNSGAARQRIFRLQWQDIVIAAQQCSREASGTERLILRDVEAFLRRRKLEYFSGFQTPELPKMQVEKMELFASTLFTEVPFPSAFSLKPLMQENFRAVFVSVCLPGDLKIERGPWR